MQIFYRKDGSIASARIRHYLGTEAGKPKFSYCNQSIAYAESELNKPSQKPLSESVPSMPLAIGEKPAVDQCGQKGQKELSSNLRTERGLSPAWLGHQPPTQDNILVILQKVSLF